MPKKSTKVALQVPARMTSSPLLHWAKRIKGDAGDENIDVRKATVTATSLPEAAALSLAIKLISGSGPKTLQSAFKSQVQKNVESFLNDRPDFQYKLGGRQPHNS